MKSFKVGKVAMTPKGGWQDGEKYNRLDVVLYQGSSYVSIIDDNDAKPTAGDAWKMLAIGSNGVAEIVEAEYSKEINNTNNFFTIDGDTLNLVGYTQNPVALDGTKKVTVTFVGSSYQCSILLCDEAGINGSGTTETVVKLSSHAGRYTYEFYPNVHDDVKYIKIGVICPGTTVSLSLKESIDVSSERMWQELKSKASVETLTNELMVALQSMGFELDNVGGGSYAYVASVGDAYFDASDKHVKYVASVGDVQDLGEPSDKKVYCNAHTKLLYIWRSGAWVNVGGVDAYTKSESDERYAVKATEDKLTALQKTVDVNYADLGGRLGYAEDAIVQVGYDVKNLRSDTVSALDKKCDIEQYDAFKQTATEKFDELDNTLAGKADKESVSALKDDVTKGMDELNTAIGNLGTQIGDTQSGLKEELSTKQDILTAGAGIVIASNVISAREEVLYDDYFYPNKKATTDLVNFRDSYEVLQPTAYVGDYTDADGTQWTNVFECESFPDWFDRAITHCYPYDNGVAKSTLYLNSFEVTDAGEVTYYMYNNKAISANSAYADNCVGIKKIDDTHFVVYTGKNTTTQTNIFNPSSVDPSLFGFGSPIIRELYDVTDCKKLRIEWSGQIKLRNQYSDLISTEGSVATGLRGYSSVQVVYGTTINDFEISDDKTKYRVTRSNSSTFYRQNVNASGSGNSSLKELSSDFVMTSRWYKLETNSSRFFNVINSGGKKTVLVATNGVNNPSGAINMGSRLRIIKLE